MEKLENLFTLPIAKPTKKRATERNALLEEFLRALNDHRRGQTITNKKGVKVELKPLSMGFIATKMAMSGIKRTEELREFLKDCKNAKHFSSYWWWSLNPENCNKKELDTS